MCHALCHSLCNSVRCVLCVVVQVGASRIKALSEGSNDLYSSNLLFKKDS